MNIVLNSAFIAFSVSLYLFSIGLVGPVAALCCYSIIGTLAVFAQAVAVNLRDH